MDKRTIELATEWFNEAGINVTVEGLKMYIDHQGYKLELSSSEILWRAECQIHLID